MKREISVNSRASPKSITKVAAATAHTLNGCALVTGSSSISPRIEFCHSAVRHKNAAATTAQKMAMARLAMRRVRSSGVGSSM